MLDTICLDTLGKTQWNTSMWPKDWGAYCHYKIPAVRINPLIVLAFDSTRE